MSESRGPRARRGAAAAIVAIATAAALMAIVAGVVRTTFPLRLDGQVFEVVHHNRNDRGTDFWVLRFEDGRRLLVDQGVDQALENRDQVHKRAWSATFATDRGPARLPTPWKLIRLVAALALVVALIAVAAFRPTSLDRLISVLRPSRERSTPIGS